MVVSLEIDPNLEYMKQKLAADLENTQLRFPPAAVKEIKEILLNDQIHSQKELLIEIKKVLISTNNFSWKIKLFLLDLSNKLSDQIHSVSLVQVGASLCLSLLFFFFYKRFKLRKKLAPLVKPATVRFGAMMAYAYPTIVLYSTYLPELLFSNPHLIILTPPFVQKLMDFVRLKQSVNYIYFFSVFFIVLSLKLPKNRFIRFHLIKGLYLSALQQIPYVAYQFISNATTRPFEYEEINKLYLFIFSLNIFWLLPGLWEALTLNYPKYPILRESIEVILGRDPEDGFKWWNQKK